MGRAQSSRHKQHWAPLQKVRGWVPSLPGSDGSAIQYNGRNYNSCSSRVWYLY